MAAPQQIGLEGLRDGSAEDEEQPWEFDLVGSAYYFRIGNVGGVTGMCFYAPIMCSPSGPLPHHQ